MLFSNKKESADIHNILDESWNTHLESGIRMVHIVCFHFYRILAWQNLSILDRKQISHSVALRLMEIDYKGAWGKIWGEDLGWRKCSLSWLWWLWLCECIHCQKSSKHRFQNGCVWIISRFLKVSSSLCQFEVLAFILAQSFWINI